MFNKVIRRVLGTPDNNTLCCIFFSENNTLRNKATTIQYGVIQTRGEKETIVGGRQKTILAGAQGCQGDIWPHNALFYMVEIHKIFSCWNTPWDVNDK